MGSGASASIEKDIEANSVDDIAAALKELSPADLARLKAALNAGSGGEEAKAVDPDVEAKVSKLGGESLAVLKLPGSSTVSTLKLKIAESDSGAVVDKQRLICGDKILADDEILKDLLGEGVSSLEVQVVLREPLELKHFETSDVRVILTEVKDGEGKFESFGFEIYSFKDKRQYGTYRIQEATEEQKAEFRDKSSAHVMTLCFAEELKKKKFRRTQENLEVNMEKGTFVLYCEEE